MSSLGTPGGIASGRGCSRRHRDGSGRRGAGQLRRSEPGPGEYQPAAVRRAAGSPVRSCRTGSRTKTNQADGGLPGNGRPGTVCTAKHWSVRPGSHAPSHPVSSGRSATTSRGERYSYIRWRYRPGREAGTHVPNLTDAGDDRCGDGSFRTRSLQRSDVGQTRGYRASPATPRLLRVRISRMA
jgi:hypothetical protein